MTRKAQPRCLLGRPHTHQTSNPRFGIKVSYHLHWHPLQSLCDEVDCDTRLGREEVVINQSALERLTCVILIGTFEEPLIAEGSIAQVESTIARIALSPLTFLCHSYCQDRDKFIEATKRAQKAYLFVKQQKSE